MCGAVERGHRASARLSHAGLPRCASAIRACVLLQNLRAQLEAHRASDIQAIEERKARHVAALMKSHDAAFQEIKNYYNEITHSNLDLIHSLKDELHELKRKEATDDRLMFDIAQENKRMTEPLKRALADVEKLTEEREVYRCVAWRGVTILLAPLTPSVAVVRGSRGGSCVGVAEEAWL